MNPRSRVASVGAPSAHLPDHMVRRRRLVDALAVRDARLVVVTGPAGSGKTVAVRDWRSTAESPTGWLSLDGRHTDPEHFLEDVVSVLDAIAPGVWEAIRSDDVRDQPPSGAVVRAVTHLSSSTRATLVLDDLHVIDRSPTTALLARLVDQIPAANLTLVICSRSDPQFPLHRFRLSGELVELREADLRFDRAEVGQFFARFPEVELTADHIDRLAERTEGWVAGLQFAALSLAGRADTDAFVDRFAGSDRHVADFLLDEVLDRQPADVRDFLLATSVLERLRADLCEEVAGPAGAGLLRRVEAEHLFLLPLDDEREWFRYHHLFGQLLRRELRVTWPDQERLSHQRAAAWFQAHGEPGLAIDHLLEAGEDAAAFDLFVTHLREYLTAGRLETVRSWLARFPPDFIDARPGRQLMAVIAHARAGQVSRAREVADRALAAPWLDGMVPFDVHVDVTECAFAAVGGDPERAIALGNAAWERRREVDIATMPADLAIAARELWGFLPVAMGRAHALLDDRAAVRHWAAVLRRQGPRLPGDLVIALGAEAWAEARNGRLRAGAELAEQAVALGTELGRGARRAMAAARIALALVHRERDELDAAMEVLAPHVQVYATEGQVALATLGEIELARVELAQGRGEDGIARLLRVRHDRAAAGTPRFLAELIDLAECRLRIPLGDLDRAQDLLEDIGSGRERTLLEARLALVGGEPPRAEALLAELPDLGGDRRRSFEVAALRARIAAADDDLPAARQVLGEVAEVAQREGAVRVFLDEGFDILDLVPSPPVGRARVASGSALVEALSERELSVLRYLPSRLSNREIGDELYVSLNTVKSHLKTIYRKLDVDRREEAVRRARQLGLL
jgi:LuxR family maltose regulon positive regulatory protein